jgi:predicted helicase
VKRLLNRLDGKTSSLASSMYRAARNLAEEPGPVRREFARLEGDLRLCLGPCVGPAETAGMLVLSELAGPLVRFSSCDRSGVDNPVGRAFAGLSGALGSSAAFASLAAQEKYREILAERAELGWPGTPGIGGARLADLDAEYRRLFMAAFPEGTALPWTSDTPYALAEFVCRSAAKAFSQGSGVDASAAGVRVTDLFSGSGVYLATLIASGILGDGEGLLAKFAADLSCTVQDPLAYQLATMNAEEALRGALGPSCPQVSFEGALLADPFMVPLLRPAPLRHGPLAENILRVFRRAADPPDIALGTSPVLVRKAPGLEEIHKLPVDIEIRKALGGASKALKSDPCDPATRAVAWCCRALRSERGVAAIVTGLRWAELKSMEGIRRLVSSEFGLARVLLFLGDRRARGNRDIRREGAGILGADRCEPVALSLLARGRERPADVRSASLKPGLSREEKLAVLLRRGHVFARGFKWRRVEGEGSWIG